MAKKRVSKVRSEFQEKLAKVEIDAWNKGGSGYMIEREGKRYLVTKDGLVPADQDGKPLTGPEAQKIIKNKRKGAKKPPATGDLLES